jgi:heat shock protein HtpX
VKRIFLFLLTNVIVVLTISLLLNVLGLRPYLSSRGIDYNSLLVTCAVIGFAGSFISLAMSRWTAKTSMGVELIDPDASPSSPEGRLVARVKRLCDQAGLHELPEIGIYRSPEVNAFATGPSRSRSLLAISTGLLDAMDSRAVDGVLGHEISHIVNGDMVTMTLLQGLVNTFVMFLARVLLIAMESASRRDRDDDRPSYGYGGGYYFHYMIVQLLESVLFLLASPVIYWYSRRREYRADWGSADLTGNATMIHALEQLRSATQVQDDRAPALSTFKINGHGRGLAQLLFSSHPSLEDRIEALKRRAAEPQ